MRTTLDINDGLYRQAKEAAARSGRALKEIIEDALRLALQPPPSQNRKRVVLPESPASPGLRPGVDLDNSASLLGLMETPDAAS